jgi:hypothetical protein
MARDKEFEKILQEVEDPKILDKVLGLYLEMPRQLRKPNTKFVRKF